jgi:hypothetical protein
MCHQELIPIIYSQTNEVSTYSSKSCLNQNSDYLQQIPYLNFSKTIEKREAR